MAREAIMPQTERTRFRFVSIQVSLLFLVGSFAGLSCGRVEEVVVTTGTVEPRFYQEIRAFEAGVLVAVKFQGGEAVKAGELMAQLDDKKLADEKVQKQGQIAEAPSELPLQEKRLASLKEEMKSIESSIDRCKFKAPFAGVVVKSLKKPGEAVAPGELIFVIAKGSAAELHVFVDQSQIAKVGLGQRVRIYPTTFDTREYGEARGRVERIFPSAQDIGGSRKVEVRIVVEDTPLPLEFGSSATAHVVVGQRGWLDMLLRR